MKIKSIGIILTLTIFVSITFVSCGNKQPAMVTTTETLTYEEVVRDLFGGTLNLMDRVRLSKDGTYRVGIDHFGNVIKLPMPENINRVVATWNSSNQTMAMLGAKEKIVGTTLNISIEEWFRKIYPEIANVYVTNAFGSYNMEEIIALEPDLVITSGQDDWKLFDDAGLTVIALNNNNYDEMKQTATFLGDVLGPAHAAKAKEYCEYVDKNIKYISEIAPVIKEDEKVSVFHIRGQLISTQGSNTMIDSFITLCGAVNSIAASISGSRNVTIEEIIAVDPDIITVSNVTTEDIYGFIMSDPQWATLSAVKNGRVYKNPVGVYNWDRNACESALQILWIATLCYPDYYPNIDMGSEVRWFYKNFYNYTLSDTEVMELLAGEGTPQV